VSMTITRHQREEPT